jgi:hypothetical protein
MLTDPEHPNAPPPNWRLFPASAAHSLRHCLDPPERTFDCIHPQSAWSSNVAALPDGTTDSKFC